MRIFITILKDNENAYHQSQANSCKKIGKNYTKDSDQKGNKLPRDPIYKFE